MSATTGLTQRQSKLSPAKQALLEKWKRGEVNIERPKIPRRQTQGPLPLSFAQERLWFIDQLLPGNPAYSVPHVLRLAGHLRVDVLAQCINEIVRRHEVLRTTFPTEDGQPFQAIAPSLTLPLPVIDLQNYPPGEREAWALRLAAEDESVPFDLADGPLIHTTLLRLDATDHVFLLMAHHIICDAWSASAFTRELSILYRAFLAGKPSPLPEPPLQYADYACWQRERLTGEGLKSQIAYWKRQLANVPPMLELPRDRPRPAIQDLRGAREQLVLSPSLSKAIKALSQEEGVTLYMTLLAAFKTLLYRYTGETDIVVGSTIANRDQVELQNLIGFLVNTLVMRTDLSGNPTFRELLGRVREVTTGAYANCDLPFEQLVEELRPERDLSRNPLFQVSLAFLNTPAMDHSPADDLTMSLLPSRKEVALFDLLIVMGEAGDRLAGHVEYSTALFEATTIVRILKHFETLLEGIVADPDCRIADLPLLTAAEHHQLLVTWNNTRVDYPMDVRLHEFFEAQVRRTPDATALVFEDQQLTYAELNSRANQLARYLRKLGVAPESPVGVCLDRSVEMVVGLLGVLKAGGAYLPLNPRDPVNRIVSLLNNSQANFLLTQDLIVDGMPFTRLQNLRDVEASIAVTDPRPTIADLDTLPFPDRSLVNYGIYNQYIGQGSGKRVISLLATRGCPYGCAYCHKIWPKKHHFRSAQNIFDEVMFHYRRGYRAFAFLDDIFNLNRQNSMEFFKLVVQNKLDVRLMFPNGLRGDILTPDFIDSAVEAGMVSLALALETASPRLQRLMGKNLNIEKLRRNLEYICKQHPQVIVDLFTMFGFPTETEEEVFMTFDFIKSIEWIHFPLLNALKIFPGTEMAELAIAHGISKETIENSTHLAFHELGETLPFSKSFARQYQAKFMKEYFLLPDRLEKVIAAQKRVLTHDEIIGRYNNYLPGGVKTYPEILSMIGDGADCFVETVAPQDDRAGRTFSVSSGNGSSRPQPAAPEQLRVLLLDLSQYFSHMAEGQVYNVVEVPLGLMYLLSYLKREYGDSVQGKILKSFIDFDSFDELKRLMEDFRPQVVGVRSLSFHKNFFHKAIALIKHWFPGVPVIVGGPYVTSEYSAILSDRNMDVAVLCEGELTFAELIGKILEHGNRLPGDEILKRIPGLAFTPRRQTAVQDKTGVGRQVLLMDKIADLVAQEETGDLERVTEPASIAYIIYTSGSTGSPKGVMNTHRGICNRLLWMQAAYQLGPFDRVLQKTPYTFDVSVWEFFWPLLAGAALVVARPEGHRDNAYLVDVIRDRKITTLHFVPSMLKVFLEEKDLPIGDSLRRVICSGEALPQALQEEFLKRIPAELHNLYGPTEAAVDVTYWPCRNGVDAPHAISLSSVPIGYPIANTQIYLLDRRLNPVPIGAPGELHIGGVNLSRGYLGRLGLTAEKFIPNPFSAEPGERLYKTGDLARYLPDGSIEFLRRLDHQVKVRGLRIELGEIESTLRQHPAVQDAIVLTRGAEHEPEHKQLIAYLIPNARAQEMAARVPAADLSTEQLLEWQSVFDDTYSKPLTGADPAFNTLGWNSSYTSLPIPTEEMRQWTDYAVERILALHPRRILDIGYGTGLLLLRLAPHCVEYWGTDFSQAALRYIQSQITQPGQEMPQVKLLQQDADNFSGIEAGAFDVVILNSVVQYFPNVEYFLRVLKGAVQTVAAGGYVVIDDVRSLPLLESFHTSVEVERASATLTTVQLRQRIQKRISQEQELVIDPGFFLALQQELPQIRYVEIQLKRGRYQNELSQFRYDVVLHVGDGPIPAGPPAWLNWQDEKLTLDALRQMLSKTAPQVLGITHVPNARLKTIVRTLALLAAPNCPETVGELRHALHEADLADVVDPADRWALSDELPYALADVVHPEDMWALGDELPYDVEVRWSDVEADNCFEVLLRRRVAPEVTPPAAASPWPRHADDRRPWHEYVNVPLQEKLVHRLVLDLRLSLKEKLPEYMLPSAFVLMDAWPLTANGKLDRDALPAPLQAISGVEENYVAPHTPVEEALCKIWAEVLDLKRVGINNNFFELGGDSIHSIRVIARANKLGFQLTPQQFFQNQTIAELAAVAGLPQMTADDQQAMVSTGDLVSAADRRKVEELLGAAVVEDVYPLGPFQDHMLHQILASNEPALYLVQRVDTLHLPTLSLPALQQTWQRLVERHAILRTSFLWQGVSQPLQIVHKQVAQSLQYEDWRALPEAEQEAQLAHYLEAEQTYDVDLTQPTGARVLLVHLAEGVYKLIQSFSYMYLDGWSFGILGNELLTLYSAFAAGQDLQLEAERPYREFIAWYKRQDLAGAQSFWQTTLDGLTAPTSLVHSVSSRTLTSREGIAHRRVWLSTEWVDRLQALAQRHRLVLNTVIQATWSLLLSAYTHQTDIVFGVAMTGRASGLTGVEDIVGTTLNILPLRVRLSPERPLLPWLKDLMAQQVELSQYAYTPLRHIRQWWGTPDDAQPFDNYLVFQNIRQAPRSRQDIPAFFVKSDEPLRIDVFPEQELGIGMSYYRRCFDDATIERLLKDFQAVLQSIAANPDQLLQEIMRAIGAE